MLKKSASVVLASFRPSTGTRPPHHSAARTDLVLLIRRTVRPTEGTPPGFDSPAALLDDLFEHPAGVFCCCAIRATLEFLAYQRSFPATCLHRPSGHSRCSSSPVLVAILLFKSKHAPFLGPTGLARCAESCTGVGYRGMGRRSSD